MRGELVSEGQADAVGGVAVDPAAVGDERDDALSPMRSVAQRIARTYESYRLFLMVAVERAA